MSRNKEMLIYLARNKINGKIYIGQTCRSLKERMGDHRRKTFKHNSHSHFHNAIKKYGFDVFEWKILERTLIKEILNFAEKYWIKKYQSANPEKGYNNTHGGDSYEFTEETKLKIGLSGKGRKMKSENIEKMRIRNIGIGNPFYGKHHTTEAKNKNRIAHIGKKLKADHIAKCIHLGEKNGNSILKLNDVIRIKQLLKQGYKYKEIKLITGVEIYNIKNIKLGYTWKHIIL